MIKHLSLTLVLVTVLTACTWVKLTPQGEVVRVAGAGEIAGCERLGEITAKVLDKAAFVKRSRDKQAEELAALARNEAGDMGADTIVAASDIHEGRRRFTVYQCR